MAMMPTDRETDRKPPYLPFKSFENFLDKLRTNNMPARIDKSVITLSGSMQNWLLSGLRFFELIQEDGTPTPILRELASADEEQRALLYRKLCLRHYDWIFSSVDLSTATTAQVEEQFRVKALSGSTVTKALAFFLTLAERGGVEVSSHIKKTGSTPRRRPAKKSRLKKPANGETQQDSETHSSSGDNVTVSIPVGLEDAWRITMRKGAERADMLRFIRMVALTFDLDLAEIAK